MRGLIAVDDVMAALPQDRQRTIAARAAALLAKIKRRMTSRPRVAKPVSRSQG
jgi:hypothetical protein